MIETNSRYAAKKLDKTPETDRDVGERVCRYGNLSFKEQQQIAGFNEQELYAYLFNGPTVYAKGKIDPKKGGWVLAISRRGLRLLPELETPAIRNLEHQIIQSLESAVPLSRYGTFAGNNMAPYLYQIEWSNGRRYIRLDQYEPPFPEDGEHTDEKNGRRISVKLEFQEVSGLEFLATPVVEPCMFFRFHPNEIKHIAPKDANSYEVGEGTFLVNVWGKGSFLSPFIAEKVLKGAIRGIPTDEGGSYAVTPIRFYRIGVRVFQKMRYLNLIAKE